MTDRRDLVLGLVAGMAGLAALADHAGADDAVTEADAKSAIEAWLGALYTGEAARIEKLLAPEFQLLRSDGSAHDRISYLGTLPKYQTKAAIGQLKITGDARLMVTTYTLDTAMTVDGQPVAAKAPRLTVFRKDGDVWQLVAHANFAQIG